MAQLSTNFLTIGTLPQKDEDDLIFELKEHSIMEIFDEVRDYHVSHEELSVELYHFSKFPGLNKIFERYSSKRGY